MNAKPKTFLTLFYGADRLKQDNDQKKKRDEKRNGIEHNRADKIKMHKGVRGARRPAGEAIKPRDIVKKAGRKLNAKQKEKKSKKKKAERGGYVDNQ